MFAEDTALDNFLKPCACSQEVDPSFPDNAAAGAEDDDPFDDVATAFFDTQLQEAVQLINMDLQQETRQVVLLGCGLDTRPCRCLIPCIPCSFFHKQNCPKALASNVRQSVSQHAAKTASA